MAPEAPWKDLLPPQRGSAQQAMLGLRTVCCVIRMPLPCWVPVFSPVALGLFPKSTGMLGSGTRDYRSK